MPRIRHIAIVTMNPEKLAEFYCDVFDMKVVQRNARGNVFLTDGYITVALLRNKAEGKVNGLNHFGFQVEDTEEIRERLKKWDVYGPADRPDDRAYAEVRMADPEGNNIDLSEHGYERAELNGERKARQEEAKV